MYIKDYLKNKTKNKLVRTTVSYHKTYQNKCVNCQKALHLQYSLNDSYYANYLAGAWISSFNPCFSD